MNKLLNWVESHNIAASYIVLALLVLFVSFALSFAPRTAHGATPTGNFTYATCYNDADPNAVPPKPCTPLTQADIANTQVEVGTCLSTSPAAFGTKEGEQLVPPPATTWSVTVPRNWGNFCARARHVTVGGTQGQYSGVVTLQRVEPPPQAPIITIAKFVFEYKSTGSGPMLGRNVGEIQLGVVCGSFAFTQNNVDYYDVPSGAVAVSVTKLKTDRLIAACQAAQTG